MDRIQLVLTDVLIGFMNNEENVKNYIEMVRNLILVNNQLNKVITSMLTKMARKDGLFNTLSNSNFTNTKSKHFLPPNLISETVYDEKNSGYDKFIKTKMLSCFFVDFLLVEIVGDIIKMTFSINDINAEMLKRLSVFIGYEHILYIRYLSERKLRITNNDEIDEFDYSNFSKSIKCSVCGESCCINDDSAWEDNETYSSYPLYCKYGCTILCDCGFINYNVELKFFTTDDNIYDIFYDLAFIIECEGCGSELSYNKSKSIDFA